MHILLIGDGQRTHRTGGRQVILYIAHVLFGVVVVAGQAHIDRVLQHQKAVLDQRLAEAGVFPAAFFGVDGQVEKNEQLHKAVSHPVHPQTAGRRASAPAGAAGPRPALQWRWSGF